MAKPFRKLFGYVMESGQRKAQGRIWVAGTAVGAFVALALIFIQSSPAFGQDLRGPVRIAQMPSGKLLVSDPKMGGVALVNPRKDRPAQVTEIPGRPIGVAFGWNKLFVGNEATHAVEVYNRRGRYLYALGKNDSHVERPTDIALDIRAGLVFVSDTGSRQVVIFHQRGERLGTLPAAGQTVLHQPTGIAVDPERREVLVSDFGQPGWFGTVAWVKIYDYDGKYLDGIPGNRNDGFGFSRPQGMALDSRGRIYLVDSLRGQVLVFDRYSKQGLATFGRLGKTAGRLMLPLDAAIDGRTGNLFVTNHLNGRIEIYHAGDDLP